MVTADVYRSTDGIERALANKDLAVLAPAAALFAGGIFVAQEVSDFVLPQLGLDAEPSDYTGLGASVVLKLFAAVALVLVGRRVGYGGLAAAFSVGLLAAAGADGIELAQRALESTGLTGSSTRTASKSRSRSRSRSRTRSASRSRSRPRSTARASGRSKPSTGGNQVSSPRTRRREQRTWG